MVNKKPVRTRGKIQLSRYFQNLKEGDSVAVVKERALQPSFPKRLQGSTRIIQRKIGRSYAVKIKTQDKYKEFIIQPVHLKKIGVMK